MEAEIKLVMDRFGFAYMQAYYHVRARRAMEAKARERRYATRHG